MQGAAIDRFGRDDVARAASALGAVVVVMLSGGSALGAQSAHHHAPTAGTHRTHFDRSGRPRSGVASFYGTHGAAKPTASGATMDPTKLTAASRNLPLGTTAKVSNVENGKSAVVQITDRGPFVKSRILDVSPKAAAKLGMRHEGTASVKVTPLHVPR